MCPPAAHRHGPRLTAAEQTSPLFVRLSFAPNAYLASAVSLAVSEFCRLAFRDPDLIERVHMAAHELAENVAKYAIASPVTVDVELAENEKLHVLTIRARNTATPERLAEVQRRLAELKATTDPAALYDHLIQESLTREGGSGLGLARIRAESGLDLDYEISGNELTVILSSSLPESPPLGSVEETPPDSSGRANHPGST